MQEVNADEKGRPCQATPYYCCTLPTGINTTTGQIRITVGGDALENSQVGFRCLHGQPAGCIFVIKVIVLIEVSF